MTDGSDDNRPHMFIAIIIRMMTKMMDAKSMLVGDQWSARGSGGEKGAPGHQRAHRGPPRRIQTNLFGLFCNLYLYKSYLWDCAWIFLCTTNVSVLSEPIKPNIRTNTNNGDPNQGAPATIWLHLILLPKDNHWQNTKREAVILLQYHGSSEIASAL